MRTIKKMLTWILAVTLVLGVIMVNPISAKAEGAKSVSFSIACDESMEDGQVPKNYGIEYTQVDSDGNSVENPQKGTVSASDKSGASLSDQAITAEYLKITVQSAGKDIFLNGENDNSWGEGKIVAFADMASSYAFQLKNPAGEPGGSEPENSSSTGDITFDINEGGTVEYSLDGQTGWTSVADKKEISFSENKTIYLKATPSEGKDLDSNDGQSLIRYNGEDHPINGEALKSLKAGTYSFSYDKEKSYSVRVRFDNASGGGSSSAASGKFNVDISVDSELSSFTPDIVIDFQESDGTSLGLIRPTKSFENADIPKYVAKAVVTMSKDNLQNARLITDSEEVDLIDAIRQNGTVTCTIDPSKGYTFKFEFSNKMNVSWSYDAATAAPDQLVEHAKIELLKSDNATDYMDKGRTDWNLTIGQDYYFVLIPDYGYQIVGLNINGQAVTPMDSVGVFKFTMTASNFHFKGIVAPEDNKVEKKTDLIGVVEIEDGAGADVNGNLKLTVAPTAADNEALNHLNQGEASDASVYGTLDLELDEIVSKGNGQYWSTNLKELKSSVELSFIVPSNKLGEGETYSIIRKHEGTYSELENVVYNPYTEKLDFKTDKFSEYTIIKKKVAVSEHRPAGDITPHYDEYAHYYSVPCVCDDENHIWYSADGRKDYSDNLEEVEPESHSFDGSGKCACGYSDPAKQSSSQEENKNDDKKDDKKDDAVTVAASVVEATTTVSADTVTLTPAIENALVQASINDTAAPVVIDMTVASEIPATLVEKIAESEATVNLTLDTGVVLGLTSDTLDGTTAAPIVVKTVEPKMIGNLLTTTTNVPADKKLVVMNPVKGATMNNTAVIYQFYGPEAAGQVVNFYAADATGKFGVLATSVVFPNGYAAFVVPVVGFVGYAQ